ncbi:ATP-binding cassette domain-containing protein [Methanobrevibacter curvatus]|uniref:Daunorubicin/doxorubicin resistance ATP-binding protein DrrA n=1 Tax=Methanobrevibacter curvatus TaxID=49547 RepID=A0A166BDW8_9EURY|nr:ATP-binding cassette domain-containing protein [Methanobrevibacter curvatus]KZX13204.1 daunorubicin/doxorubicin resistance ATP-binding protein DrrA [Methanobrevibacter curvatus]
MTNIIETKNLSKTYDEFKAVDSINLKIKKNSVYGILGPNGAGKSTLISMLCTILKPSSGKAIVNGYDVEKESNKVRDSIGIVFQTRAVDNILTGREHLEMHAALYGVDKNVRKERINDVLELIALGSKIDEHVKNYSGGMVRRLEIGRGLIHHPQILFLDEPTLGLDLRTRESIWKYIEELKNTIDITVILTTHYLEEADHLCDEIAIIDNGKIIKTGSPKKLKEELKSDIITLKTSEKEKFSNILENKSFIQDIFNKDDELKLSVEKGENLIPKIIKIAEDENINIKSIEVSHPSLEDVFIKYTGRKISDTSFNKKSKKMRR